MWQAPWTLRPLLSSSVSHVNGQWLWRTQAWEIKAREDHLEKQRKPSHSGGSGINWISRQIQYDKVGLAAGEAVLLSLCYRA